MYTSLVHKALAGLLTAPQTTRVLQLENMVASSWILAEGVTVMALACECAQRCKQLELTKS